jgi:hypothetical protein
MSTALSSIVNASVGSMRGALARQSLSSRVRKGSRETGNSAMAGDITSHVLAGRQRQTHQEMIVGRTDGPVHAIEPEAEAICAIIIGATLDLHADKARSIARVISVFEPDSHQRVRQRSENVPKT